MPRVLYEKTRHALVAQNQNLKWLSDTTCKIGASTDPFFALSISVGGRNAFSIFKEVRTFTPQNTKKIKFLLQVYSTSI